MTCLRKIKNIAICFMMSVLVFSGISLPASAATSRSINFVILSRYAKTMSVGQEFYLIAFNSAFTLPTFKSSNSSIASVNSYGRVTAKKAGSCRITAKISKAEASCKVTVKATKIVLNKTSVKIENGARVKLQAKSSTGHSVSWKSSKESVATVSESGLVTAQEPGEAYISASCDGKTVRCHITVKSPVITLSTYQKTLYVMDSLQLSAKVSSGRKPTWKSAKTSVAVVDENGKVTAIGQGITTITATVDGVSKYCIITVKQK